MSKKVPAAIIAVFFFITFGLTLTACSKTYADDLTYVKWESVNPEMEITVLNKGEGFGYIIHEGEKIEFYFIFFLNVKFNLHIKSKANSEIEIPLGSPDVIGSCKYYKKDNLVVLLINQDNIFDNKYPTIKLTAADVDLQKIDPKERYEVSWTAEKLEMSFHISKGQYNGGKGTVIVDSVEKQIYFEWNDGRRFSVYLLSDTGDKQQNSIMEGSYDGGGGSFIINPEKDGLFNNLYPDITFVAHIYKNLV